jgi:hypothetical protein
MRRNRQIIGRRMVKNHVFRIEEWDEGSALGLREKIGSAD